MLEYTSSVCVTDYSPATSCGKWPECPDRVSRSNFADAQQLGSGGSHLEIDGNGAMGTWEHDGVNHGIEHELTVRLERASDLSERAKRANDAEQHEIERALQIADELRGVSLESESRERRLRGSQRDR